MSEKTPLRESDLAHFTGTERWYRHPLNRHVLYTDGARHVADAGGAYWLLDAIATLQCDERVRREEFQVWRLKVGADRSAVLSCEDGNSNVVLTQVVPFTDFPLPEIALWLENNVIYLPSEH